MKRRGFIGDEHLKKFKRGNLFQNQPCTELDYKIFYLFVKGVSLEKVQSTLTKDNVAIVDQKMFDIIRHVGLEVQTFYRKTVNQPSDKHKLIFADFVKGTEIAELAELNQIPPMQLFVILRKIGLLYYTYKKMNKI